MAGPLVAICIQNGEDVLLRRSDGRRPIRHIAASMGVRMLTHNPIIRRQMAAELGLAMVARKSVRMPDGSARAVPVCGPVRISYGNRQCYTDVLVDDDAPSPELGRIAMAWLDLVVIQGVVMVNPESPDLPSARV